MYKSDRFCFSKSFGIVAFVLFVLLLFTVGAANLTKKQVSTNSRASEISSLSEILPFKFVVSFSDNDIGPDGSKIYAQELRPSVETNKTAYLTSIGGTLVGEKFSCGFGTAKPEWLTNTTDHINLTPRILPDSFSTYCDYREARNGREITMSDTIRYTKIVDNKVKEFSEKYTNKIKIYNYYKNEDVPLSVQFLYGQYGNTILSKKLPQDFVRLSVKTNQKEYLDGIGGELIGVMFSCNPFSETKLRNIPPSDIGNVYSVSCDYRSINVGEKFKMQYWLRYYDADGISRVEEIGKDIEIVSK